MVLNHFENWGNLYDDDRRLGCWGETRTQQTVALGSVFAALNADCIQVIEELGSNAKYGSAAALECFAAQLGIRAPAEEVQRSKPQLKLVVMYTSGTEFRLIGVYAKSKAPHSAKNVAEVLRTSIANLRKQ